jgi:hypothetical protein
MRFWYSPKARVAGTCSTIPGERSVSATDATSPESDERGDVNIL